MIKYLLCALLLVPTIVCAQPPSTILISIDGFRWDYIEKHNAKHIGKLASEGVRVNKLIPQYPSKTFPNHLSLITGLKPINHGLVDNHFCDNQRQQCYKMGRGKIDSSWIQGVPLWNLVKMHGYKSAAYFWPESDARINGMTPDYYYHYAKKADYQNRLDQIVSWLQLPQAQRPLFIASYFSLVDTKGHEFGPDHPQTKAAVHYVDELIGKFVSNLKTKGISANLVLVSDHGMAKVKETETIAIEPLAIPEGWTVKNSGTRVSLYTLGQSNLDTKKLLQQLRDKAQGRYQVLEKSQLAKLYQGNSPRVADIVLQAQAPRVFSQTGELHYQGTHGFEPNNDMAAFFVAKGPAFKSGIVIESASNLELYPTLAKVMGLTPVNSLDSDGKNLLQLIK